MSNRKLQILKQVNLLLKNSNDSQITTALLASKVGVTEAALYRHYSNKNAIFAELFRFIDGLLVAKLFEMAEKPCSAEDIKTMVATILMFIQQNQGLSRLILGCLSSNDLLKKSNDLYHNINKAFTIAITNGIKAKNFSDNSSQIVTLIVSLIYGIVNGYLLSSFKNNINTQFQNDWAYISNILN